MYTKGNTIIILLVVALAAGGAYWFLQSGDAENGDAMEGENAMEHSASDGAMMEDGEAMEGDAMEGSEGGAMMKDDEGGMMKKEEEGGAMMNKSEESGAMMEKGSYEAYAPEKLAKAENGTVVLFFRASWCPTCRTLDADIKKNLGSIPAGTTILDVDYDESTALKQKYGVTYQHTLVQVDADGNQIAKWQGSRTLAALLGEVQ